MREQTGRLQQLLYLAPDTDGTPIVQRPVREDPRADWDRLRSARAFWSTRKNSNPSPGVNP